MEPTVDKTMYAILRAVPIGKIAVEEIMNGDIEASCLCEHCMENEWYPVGKNEDPLGPFEEWSMCGDVVLCDTCTELASMVITQCCGLQEHTDSPS